MRTSQTSWQKTALTTTGRRATRSVGMAGGTSELTPSAAPTQVRQVGFEGEAELSSALRNLACTMSATTQSGWITGLLLSKDLPTVQSWFTKYSLKPLLYEKDWNVVCNSLTQLGVEYTGGGIRESIEDLHCKMSICCQAYNIRIVNKI
jgi:hypothetical protein